jgi:hypothetical protein
MRSDTTSSSAAIGVPCCSCLVYRVRNIGDMIQTLALTRLLPTATGVFRHALASAPSDRVLVVNGFLERDTLPRNGPPCLFAGVSGPYERHHRYISWMERSPWPIGARDPVTARRLASAALPTEMVGCATLTLPRYEGPRRGVFSVDVDGPGTPLTHDISRHDTVEKQWKSAASLLGAYRTAEAVYTSRLHVALPCLAFGTPVWIARPTAAPLPERFSIVDAIGVPFERLTVHDVTPFADRYKRFLATYLGSSAEASDPVMPRLVTADSLGPRERARFFVDDLRHSLRSVRHRAAEWFRGATAAGVSVHPPRDGGISAPPREHDA